MNSNREFMAFPFRPPDLALSEVDKPPITLREVFNIIKQRCLQAIQQDKIQNYGWLLYDNIETLVEILPLPNLAPKDIEEFCGQMSNDDWGDEQINMRTPHAFFRIAGYTLSAFLNRYMAPSDTVNLDIHHLEKVGYLGNLRQGTVHIRGIRTTIEYYENQKIINVTNNLGPGIGEYLHGGALELWGDYVEEDLGKFMDGGRLVVHGDVKKGPVFRCMKGGEGIIEGSAENHIGIGATGGSIKIGKRN